MAPAVTLLRLQNAMLRMLNVASQVDVRVVLAQSSSEAAAAFYARSDVSSGCIAYKTGCRVIVSFHQLGRSADPGRSAALRAGARGNAAAGTPPARPPSADRLEAHASGERP